MGPLQEGRKFINRRSAFDELYEPIDELRAGLGGSRTLADRGGSMPGCPAVLLSRDPLVALVTGSVAWRTSNLVTTAVVGVRGVGPAGTARAAGADR